MYIGTGQFGDGDKAEPEAKDQPGFLKKDGPTFQPKKEAVKPLEHRIKHPEEAKILAKKRFEPSTPETKLLKTEFLNQKYSWQVASLNRNLKDVEAKTKASKLYVDMLKQYLKLPVSDRRFVHSWIKEHEAAIRKFKSGRELEKKAEELQAAIALASIRLNYWNKLHGLQKKGVNAKGDSIIKRIKPTSERIESGVYETPREMPVFQPKLKSDPIKKAVEKSKKIMNLGDIDEGKLLLSPIMPKKSRKELVETRRARMFDADKFAEALPDDNDYFMLANRAKDQGTRLIRKSRKSVDNYWEKEKIRELQKKIIAAKKQDEAAAEQAKQLLSKIKKSDKAAKLDTTVLGILLEAKPEKFITAPTLIEGIKSTFKRLTDVEKKSVLKTAEAYLKNNADLTEKLMKDLESKEDKLRMLRGEPAIERKAPVALGYYELSESDPNTKLMTLLPWLVAGFFIYKIYMRGR